ncbi:MAG: glycosyltransferase family 61 protein [Chlamydiales bacterium]|nr:glycosyltransferase family 61 protein [Chlamydiales bacterium]
MMKMRLASKTIRFMREGVKRGCAHLAAASFRSHSYPVFGIPSGLATSPSAPVELYPQEEAEPLPPKTLDALLHWRYREALEKKRVLQKTGLLTLPRATATSFGGNLTEGGKLVTTFLQTIDGKPPHQHDLFRFSVKRFLPKIYRSDHPVVTLAAGWQGAFYHWMFEVLPRIELAERGGYVLDRVFAAQSEPFQRESLELMGIAKEAIIDASCYDAVAAPSLIVPSIPRPPTSWGCAFLRERLLPKLDLLPRKRLYLSRRDAGRRRVINEDEVYGLLRGFGFERIELSNLPFKKQIELFRSAECVVGPHGAGFSHLAFCDPGTPFLEFFHPGYVNICYWNLCSIMGHHYYYLFGEGERYPDRFDPKIDPDITIDIKKLKMTLELILHDHLN